MSPGLTNSNFEIRENKGIRNTKQNQNRRGAHEIVGSRRKHRQTEGHGVDVGIDVVEHSDSWKTVLINGLSENSGIMTDVLEQGDQIGYRGCPIPQWIYKETGGERVRQAGIGQWTYGTSFTFQVLWRGWEKSKERTNHGNSPSNGDSRVTNPACSGGLGDGDRGGEKREYGNK
jgi:hypothetical protein